MAKNLTLSPLLPAFALLALAACTPKEGEYGPPPPPQTDYSALGQEPGWALRMDRERISYTGDYGDTRITVARPLAIATATGRRYETSRLTVVVTPGRCNDAMSGRGFEDVVTVTAGGRTVRGCGGARRTDYDE